MNRLTRLNVALFVATLTVFGGSALLALGGRGGPPPLPSKPVRGVAQVAGPSGSDVKGVVTFSESPAGKYAPTTQVTVSARISGLTPGRHGFHIHENGVCDEPGYTTAGGHFDPGPFGHSNPVDANHPYHAGDLPNLVANSAGIARLVYVTSRVTLRQSSGHALSLFDANGSAVIVHQNPDLGQNGVTGASGGPRAACGVITQQQTRP